jgi:hypothetical protein
VAAQDDLVTSLKAIMVARLEELGDPPNPEELLAYRDGLLEPEEREKIEAKMVLHPDAARALADLAAFPDVEAAPGTPELSDDEVGARWQSFRRSLEDRGSADATNEVATRTIVPKIAAPPVARRRFPELRLAAALLLGIGLGWAGSFAERAWRDRPDSAINVQIVELAPGNEGVRSAPSAVTLAKTSEELVLVLGGREQEERDFPAYEAEIVDAAGRRVWSRQGLQPTELGTFLLSFHRGVLEPGRYRIDLFGRNETGKTPLASYDLQVQADAEPL